MSISARSAAAHALVTQSGRLVWCDESFAAHADRADRPPGEFADALRRSEEGASRESAGIEAIKRVDLTAAGEVSAGDGESVWLIRVTESPCSQAGEAVDPTTGVLTRSAILDRLADGCQRAVNEPMVLLFLDLDGFKEVNDRWGHLTGDACLGEVGRRLQRALRAGDAVGRFGGDEFLILLDGPADPASAAPIVRRLIDVIAEPCSVRGESIRLGASVGVAAARPGEPPEALIERADRAMYRDKAARQERGDREAGEADDVADPAELG